ncbi:MAG: sensor histidine kinase [Solirubrobacteraceae bacterium]
MTTQVLQTSRSDAERLALVVLHADLDPAPITGDPRLLEQLLTNLIDNAIRHSTMGGHIEITTGTRDRRTFLLISNTGTPVPQEAIHRLFQPFERLIDVRTGHDNGHGLGLPIIEAITRAHRAQITARARPDGGLTIQLHFPLARHVR